MTADDVLEVLDALAPFSLRLDGGWGIDALAGEQTREHADLDMAVDADALDGIRRALAPLGYRHDESAWPGLPARLVLVDDRGRQVDCHPLRLDAEGNGWQQLSDTGRAWGRYPAEHLRATGRIAGREVPCISAELQLHFHLGWEWDEKAEHDVGLLLTRFALGPLPPQRPKLP